MPPTSLTLPCVRCGRAVPVDAPSPLPTCGRCRGVTTFEVRSGLSREKLDAAAIRARLVAGSLAPTDLVVEDGVTTAIAAHPAFRAWFLPGHPDAVGAGGAPPASAPPLPVTVAPQPGAARRIFGIVGGLSLAALLAGGALLVHEAGVDGVLPEGLVADASPPAAPADPAAGTGAAPGAPHVVDTLLARVGVVEEPRAALLAEAWARRSTGTAKGRTEAIAAAERAVARAPGDVEALALLASLYAEADQEFDLRRALLERASGKSPTAPSVRRAAVLVALAGGDPEEARLQAEACGKVAPEDLLCREAAALALEGALRAPKPTEAENALYRLDELAAAWPENHTLGRRAALLAARADAIGAEARLDAELKRDVRGAELLAAQALLAYRNGTPKRARAVLGRLEAPPDALLVEAAGEAVGRGAHAEALRHLERLTGRPSAAARLYEAQARVLAVRAGTGKAADAVAAAERLAEVDPNGPAAVQARMAVYAVAGDRAGYTRAWDALQPRAGTPIDVARTWLFRASQDLADDHPREALLAADAAVAADGSEPATWLWKASAQLAADNAPGALAALRSAVVAVDGRHVRRRPYGGALPVPADPGTVRTGLARLLADDPRHAADLAFGTAAVAWLAGDLGAALAAVEPAVVAGSDAEALGLKARLLLARGQAAGALAAIDAALARSPKEAAFHLVRAEALLGAGRVAEAEAALTLARSGNVPAISLHLLTARLAERKGDAAAALVARRAAAAADPDDLVVRRALRGVSED